MRPYRDGDLDAVVDILMRAIRTAYTFMDWPHADDTVAGYVTSALPRWDEMRMAMLNDRTAGFACLEGDCVDQLFVAPEFQRNGVGSRLLADIKRLRPEGFMLYTFQANLAARAFYESHGLVATDFGVSEAENEPDVTYRWNPDVR